MPGEIKSLEIFAAGTWTTSSGKKVTITEADLAEIVSNFGALKDTNIVKPHLKLGHTDAQKWFGQTNGIPTLGWIDRIWQQGSKIFADIMNVPSALIDLIQQGRYHNVSAEVYPAGIIEHNGAKLGPVLSAVAILGTEMPAVKDLAGLASALFANQFTSQVTQKPDNFTKDAQGMYTQEQLDALIAAAVTKAVAEAAGKFSDQINDLKTQLEVTTARAVTAEKKVVDLELDFGQKQVDALIESAIKEGKILPAQKDMVKAFATNLGTAPIKFGGKEVSPVQHFTDFINSFGKQVNIGATGSGANNQGGSGGNFSTPAQEVDHLTREAMKSDPKLSYGDAFNAVLAKDPDLKQRYAEGSN